MKAVEQTLEERDAARRLAEAVDYALCALAMQNPPDWYRRLDNALKAYCATQELFE